MKDKSLLITLSIILLMFLFLVFLTEKKENETAYFKPYMQEVQNNIKQNWQPPHSEKTEYTTLLFTINRMGEIIGDIKIKDSSGRNDFNEAAIQAVRDSAPFKQLPEQYKEDTVSIDFTLHYNVYKTAQQKDLAEKVNKLLK